MPQATVTTPDDSAALEGRPVQRAAEQLRTHPVYLKVCGPLAAATIPEDQVDFAPIIEPLLVTRDGLILDDHERWALARHQGRKTLPCFEYDLNEEDALTFMLRKHRRTHRLNDFCRIVMALTLEPYWRDRARERQCKGGKEKLSSNLTEAKPIDVRAEVARVAGVGAGNVTKVKQLLKSVTPKVYDALRRGEVKIHRAWQWRVLPPNRQNAELNKYLNRKNVRQSMDSTIECLLSNHEDYQDNGLSIEHFADRLARAEPGVLANARLIVTEMPWPTIVVARDLYECLPEAKHP